MLWIYILLGLILIVALLMLIPIRIYVSYYEEFKCRLYVGFVKLQIYPPKPKKEKPKKKSKKAEPKKEEPKKEKQSLVKEKGIVFVLELVKKIADLATTVLKDFFKHILIKKLELSIKIAGSDAADTAIKYGKCCSAVYPAVSIIASTMNCPKYGVDILPDFNENAKSEVKFELIARVFVFRLVTLVIKHGLKALKLLSELVRNPN